LVDRLFRLWPNGRLTPTGSGWQRCSWPCEEDSRQGVRVDREYVRSSEFRDAYAATLESAVQARRASMREHYAAALARTATVDRPSEYELPVMLDALDSLQPAHMALLAVVANDPQPPSSAWDYFRAGTPQASYLRQSLPLDADLLERCWDDLANGGILASVKIPRAAGTRNPPAVSAFGRRFMTFVTPSPRGKRGSSLTLAQATIGLGSPLPCNGDRG